LTSIPEHNVYHALSKSYFLATNAPVKLHILNVTRIVAAL